MADLATIEQQVEKYLRRSIADLDQTQRVFLINTVRRSLMRGKSLRFLQVTAAVSIPTPYADTAAIPTDYGRKYLLRVYDSANKLVVSPEWMTREKQFHLYPDETELGDPERYTIWEGKFILRPKPTAVYTYYFDYHKLLPDLALAGPTSDAFTEHAADVLVFGATRLGFALLGEETQAALFNALYREVRTEFFREQSIEEVSGRTLLQEDI